MVHIRPCKTEDLLKIRAMSTAVVEDIMSSKNLMPDSAVVAESEEGAFLGAAYVLMTSSFREEGSARAFLKGAFQAVPGSEAEIEASEALLDFLQEFTEKTQEARPEKRVILQIFGDAGSVSYQEFLMERGFQPKQLMTEMERDLSDLSDLPEGKRIRFKTAEDSGLPVLQRKMKGFFRRLAGSVSPFNGAPEGGEDAPDIRALEYYTSAHHWEPEAYRALSAECFGGMPDSTEDIDFLLDHGGTVYFAEEPAPPPEEVWEEEPVFVPGELIATVMTWRIDKETAATENICCSARYRRLGVVSGMLSNVLSELQKAGFKRARLNIFSDNIPAYRLYRKLGYGITRNLIEYHYETRPEYRDY